MCVSSDLREGAKKALRPERKQHESRHCHFPLASLASPSLRGASVPGPSWQSKPTMIYPHPFLVRVVPPSTWVLVVHGLLPPSIPFH